MHEFTHLVKEQMANGSCRIFDDRRYDKTIEKIDALVAIARQDFPDLKAENMTIEQYGPPRHQRMIGLEFMACGPIPTDYELVSEFDLIA